MARAAEGMRRRGVEASAIFTSPLLRARQTSELVARALGVPPERNEVLEELGSGAKWVAVQRALRNHGSQQSVILVGHQPDLSSMASEILGSTGEPVDFGPGSLACFEVDRIPPRAPGRLLWLLTLAELEGRGTA